MVNIRNDILEFRIHTKPKLVEVFEARFKNIYLNPHL